MLSSIVTVNPLVNCLIAIYLLITAHNHTTKLHLSVCVESYSINSPLNQVIADITTASYLVYKCKSTQARLRYTIMHCK